jgi:predicted metal-binding membrane protein
MSNVAIGTGQCARAPQVGGRAPRVLEAHPEWWVLAASGLAWLVLAGAIRTAGQGPATMSGHGGAGMPVGMLMPRGMTMPTHGPSAGVLVALGSGWLVMVVAMMLPSAVPSIRYVAFASLHARRARAMGLFSVGYLLVWLLPAGPAVLWHLFHPLPIAVASGVGLGLAAAWELTPQKRWALRRCRRTIPIRARGLAADRSCLRFGVLSGGRCVSACGPAMAAVVLAGHQLPVVAIVTGSMFAQRVCRRGERLRSPVAGLLALAAVATGLG